MIDTEGIGDVPLVVFGPPMVQQEIQPTESVTVPDIVNFPNNNNNKEEKQMAEVDTTMLAGQHSDIRREAVEHTNEIVKEGLKGDYATQSAISGLERANSTQIDMLEDVMNNQFMTVARDTQDIRAQVISAQQAMVTGFLGAAKDAEINSLKTQVELAKQTTYLSDKIDAGNNDLRALINAKSDADNQRMLIERATEIIEERGHARHWRGHYDQSQFQALNSQLQAFQSQLQEARQSTVNFGSMSGNAGRNQSTNNVA